MEFEGKRVLVTGGANGNLIGGMNLYKTN